MANSQMFVVLMFLILLENNCNGVFGLRDMSLKIPEAVKIGSSVTLICDYDLESVALYSIKWYRNDEEFYRYTPKESPPSQTFTLPYLNVNISKSNSKEVTLNNVQRKTSGQYKCEVTSDAPLFHTDIKEAPLLVVEIPEGHPKLTTDMQKVAPGEKIYANCSSPGSYPAVNLTWYINDEMARPDQGIRIQNFVSRSESFPGLETVQSAISVKSTPDIFRNGKTKLRCLTTMFTLYASSEETEIQEDAPQLALIMVPISQSSGGSSTLIQFHILCLVILRWLLRPNIWHNVDIHQW